MHGISSYRGKRRTHTHIHTQTNKHTHPQTGPITIHCATKLSTQCNNVMLVTLSSSITSGISTQLANTNEFLQHSMTTDLKTNEKSDRRRVRRRKHCALAVVRRSQKFRPTTDPFPGERDGQNLISWRRSLRLPDTTSLVRIDACNFELSW